MDRIRRGFCAEEHTADLALALWGESLEELFLAGLEGITNQLTDGASPQAAEHRLLNIEAVDREDLLVRWLNEILHLATCEGFLCSRAEIEVRDKQLIAQLSGEAEAFGRLRQELKAATYHDLSLRTDEKGWSCRVVIDV